MDEQSALGRQISFSEFKKATHHKGVDYVWTPNMKGGVRAFSAKKFYCNKDYKSGMLSMPKFMLAMETTFYRAGENEFRARSEFGTTSFRIISEDEEITRQENEAFEKEVAEEN